VRGLEKGWKAFFVRSPRKGVGQAEGSGFTKADTFAVSGDLLLEGSHARMNRSIAAVLGVLAAISDSFDALREEEVRGRFKRGEKVEGLSFKRHPNLKARA